MQIQVSDGFHRLHLRPSYQCTARECERKVELKSCFGCCLNIGMKDPSHEFPIRTFRFVSFGKRDYGSREGNISLQRMWHFCRQKVATTLITHCVCVCAAKAPSKPTPARKMWIAVKVHLKYRHSQSSFCFFHEYLMPCVRGKTLARMHYEWGTVLKFNSSPVGASRHLESSSLGLRNGFAKLQVKCCWGAHIFSSMTGTVSSKCCNSLTKRCTVNPIWEPLLHVCLNRNILHKIFNTR